MILFTPGSGPVADATSEQGEKNMETFVSELDCGASWRRARRRSNDGRWRFFVVLEGRRVDVEMPGAPLDVVRDGPVLRQPRLYVDGSSWYWPYALKIARHALAVVGG